MKQTMIQLASTTCFITKAQRFASAALVLVCAFLLGCSGDARPLEEAVTANNLRLSRIEVEPPAGSVIPADGNLSANTGVSIAFGIKAWDTNSRLVALSSSNRRWSVNDTNVATIDENGLLYTRANGQVEVSVQVGPRKSNAFLLDVQDATLTGIARIEGDETIERCLPKNYTAIGVFNNQYERALPNVLWQLSAEGFGGVAKLDDARGRFNAVNVGMVDLIASVGDISLSKSIEIEDTLQSLRIAPEIISMEQGSTLQLNASATYLKEDVERTAVPVTLTVGWRVPDRNGIASVANNADERGQLTASAIGNTTVTAFCGDLAQQKTVLVVAEDSTSTASELSFQNSSPVQLQVAGAPRQLNISEGSSYVASEDISTSATWEITGRSGIVSLNASATIVTVTPLIAGSTTVRATYDGLSESIEIVVVQ